MLGEGTGTWGRRRTSVPLWFLYFKDMIYLEHFLVLMKNHFCKLLQQSLLDLKTEKTLSCSGFPHLLFKEFFIQSWAVQSRKGFSWSTTYILFGFFTIPGLLILPISNQKDLCFKEKTFPYWEHFYPAPANSIPIFALNRRGILVRISLSTEVASGVYSKV